MIFKVLKIARTFRRVQFENFQNREYLLFTNCTRRSCDFLFIVYIQQNYVVSMVNRYSYEVQFGINCTAPDQLKLSNFVECNIKAESTIAQFRIPGRTGASCVKTHQSEANAGKK